MNTTMGEGDKHQQIIALLAAFFGLDEDDVEATIIETVHRQLTQLKRTQERAAGVIAELLPEQIEVFDMMSFAAFAIFTLAGNVIEERSDDIRQFRQRIGSVVQTAAIGMTVGADPLFRNLVPPFPQSIITMDEAPDVMHTIAVLADLCLCVGYVAGSVPSALTPDKIEEIQIRIKRIHDDVAAAREDRAGEDNDG